MKLILIAMLLMICIGQANATLYLSLTMAQVLDQAEFIVKGRVLENHPTDDHRRSCVFQVDKVLSGSLSSNVIQVNRDYIRMGYPRDHYGTSESLIFCLSSKNPSGRPWPRHSESVPEYNIIGADGEGECPIKSSFVLLPTRDISIGEKQEYGGKDHYYRTVSLARFEALIRDFKSAAGKAGPDLNVYLAKPE